VALRLGMSPGGWGRALDHGAGLVRMKAERAQGFGLDVNGPPAMPVTVVAGAAGEVAENVVGGQRHPVDAALTQSSADSRRGGRAAGHVLVAEDGDPVGHGSSMRAGSEH